VDKMKDRVIGVLMTIKNNNAISHLKECQDIVERYKKIKELFPEISSWEIMPARQLIFFIQHCFNINFGICPFYYIDDEKQYCLLGDEIYECTCQEPQFSCILINGKEKNKNPEAEKIISNFIAKEIKENHILI